MALLPTRVPRVHPDLVGRSPQSNPQSSQSFADVSAIFEQMTSGLTGPYAVSRDTQDSNHSGLQRQLRLHGHQGHGMLSVVGPAMERCAWRLQKPHIQAQGRERCERWSENKSLRDAWSVVQWCAKRMISATSLDVYEMTCMFVGVLASPPQTAGPWCEKKCYRPAMACVATRFHRMRTRPYYVKD